MFNGNDRSDPHLNTPTITIKPTIHPMCPIDFEDDFLSSVPLAANHEVEDNSTEFPDDYPSSAPPVANNEDEDEGWLAEELEYLAAVPDLSELERQVFIACMGWGKEGIKTYDEIAQHFKMTNAEARSIERDVRRRFLIQKQCFKPKRFHLAPPAEGTLSPRDGDSIKETSDVLFLAKLLEEVHATGWAESWRDQNGGHCYMAITKPESPALKGHHQLKLRTLRQILQEHGYWGLRRLIALPDGHKIELPPSHALKHPIQDGSDPLLEEHLVQCFHSWANATPPVIVPAGHVLCPVCGPMAPIIATVSSPEVTWQMMCGRAYDYTCCSGCLGVLDSRLAAMN